MLEKCVILIFKPFSPYYPKIPTSASLPDPSQATPVQSQAPPWAALLSHTAPGDTAHSQGGRGSQPPPRPGRLVVFPQPSAGALQHQPAQQSPPNTERASKADLLRAVRPEDHTAGMPPHPQTCSPPSPTATHAALPPILPYTQDPLRSALLPPCLAKAMLLSTQRT